MADQSEQTIGEFTFKVDDSLPPDVIAFECPLCGERMRPCDGCRKIICPECQGETLPIIKELRCYSCIAELWRF